jgi:hypothetical protein
MIRVFCLKDGEVGPVYEKTEWFFLVFEGRRHNIQYLGLVFSITKVIVSCGLHPLSVMYAYRTEKPTRRPFKSHT